MGKKGGNRKPSSKPEEVLQKWRQIMAMVFLYNFARMMASTAQGIFAEFRRRREPGALAPTANK